MNLPHMEAVRFLIFGGARRNAPIFAFVMLLSCGCRPAAPPAAMSIRLATTNPACPHGLVAAKDLFYKTVGGDLNSLAPSLRMLYDMGGGESSDPQVVAYTGAATLLKSSHAPLLEKSGLALQGLALEDKAVAQAPNDLEVRFLRGVTCYRLPKFMGRSEMASSDLAYVAQRAEPAVQEGRLDLRAGAAALAYYGKDLEQNYDAAGAIAAWRAALRIDPDSIAARDAMKHLAEHHVAPSANRSDGQEDTRH